MSDPTRLRGAVLDLCNVAGRYIAGDSDVLPEDVHTAIEEARAALSTTPAPLDAAWAAAEAALPEGWHLAGIRHRWQFVTTREDATGERCREYSFGAGLPSYQATVYQPNEITLAEDAVEGWGPTPAAALLALAEKLREYARP